MYNLLFRFFLISLFLFSCKQSPENQSTNSDDKSTYSGITESDISKVKFLDYGLDKKTENIVESWGPYIELANIISNLKKGDLSFFKNNNEVTASLLKDLIEKIPDTLNTPSINARLVALETKFLKLESSNNLATTLKEELLQNIKELLETHSNLNLQMNKKLEKDSQIIENPN